MLYDSVVVPVEKERSSEKDTHKAKDTKNISVIENVEMAILFLSILYVGCMII
jgi:branched-subunit amino acid permease